MLLRVAIDPDVGREIAGGREKPPTGLLLRHLRERCLLALGPGAGAAELISTFSRCGSAELAMLIGELLSNRLADSGEVASVVPMDQVETDAEVESWHKVAELLLMTQWRSDWLAEDRRTATPEVSSFRDALQCRAFVNLEETWNRWVDEGERREDVWRRST
jgi:hypothetical protein